MIYATRKSTALIVLHCTETPEGKEQTVKDIDRLHRKRGLNGLGFHYLVHLDGAVSSGRPEEVVGAHAQNHNANSVAVAYVGGTDKSGAAKDTRTAAQKACLKALIEHLRKQYPEAAVVGHRDILQNNGRADPFKTLNECPCFEASEYA